MTRIGGVLWSPKKSLCDVCTVAKAYFSCSAPPRSAASAQLSNDPSLDLLLGYVRIKLKIYLTSYTLIGLITGDQTPFSSSRKLPAGTRKKEVD